MGSRLEKGAAHTRKRIEAHRFEAEDGEEYGGSVFGGFTDYFRRKKIKLQNLDADLRAQSGDSPAVFRGIVAHVNGYTQPSLNDLHTLIVQHGGGFLQYLDGKTTVTHIIASSLTPKKVVEFRRYRVVKPAWVVDSIHAGKLLPWNDYRVVDEGEKQNVLAFDRGKAMSPANTRVRGYRDQTDASWYTSQLKQSQAGASRTRAPSSSVRPQSTKQRTPTPSIDDIDDIDDWPPSHQPEPPLPQGAPGAQEAPLETPKPITPPETSPPSRLDQAQDGGEAEAEAADDDDDDDNDDTNDSLYEDPTPPSAAQPPVEDVNGPRIMDFVAATVSRGPGGRDLTAEEHNAILLRDPKIRKSTVVDPNFLEQYYRESRLHHLSTWKADLKAQMQALANEKSASQKAKQRRPTGARRYILHVDFDSFFAAVSLKKNPQYKDKPCVVAHGQGSGSEIASCNYPARKFGVKNGMWMRRAQELCPDIKILPYDFPAYEEASRAFYDAIISTDGIVQSVSIDEALIDVSTDCIAISGSDGRKMHEGTNYREQARANEIAQNLRNAIKQRTGCEVSVGIGGNILLAKVALRKAKPAGQHQIKPEEILHFIGELQVQDLPGVAWSLGGKLEELGVTYVKDIRELSRERLVQALGPKTGEKLWEYARGIDRQEVGEQAVRKSVSAEVNWGVRFENQDQVDEFFANLCSELQKRLLKEKVKGKQFTLKIMRRSPDAPLDPPKHLGHGKCDTHNKSMALGVATNSKEVFTKEALSMLKGFGFTPGELRGIGVQVTKLEPMRSATDGTTESSQRRLQFKVGTERPPFPQEPKSVGEEDPIQDEPETPHKQKATSEEERVAFGAAQLNQSTPSKRPLNTLGTQFIMPTQVDPKVLAELPADIRSKLLQQSRQISPTLSSRPKLPFPMTALPAQSQLDPEILAALPAEVRAEILNQYAAGATPGSPSRRPRHVDQTLLPQSPRKNRIIGIPANKALVPVKRGRGRPPKSAMLAAAAQTKSIDRSGKTLTQANFISLKNPAREPRSREEFVGPVVSGPNSCVNSPQPARKKDADELDPDFLSALPEEIRKEVMEEHKRKKLSAFRLAVNKRRAAAPVVQAPRQSKVLSVPRPARPTFTTQKLSKEKDLRRAMKEWVNEFADEGPYDEDVGALLKFLKKVMLEEKDLGKAVGVVKWLGYVIETLAEEKGDEVEELEWDRAVQRIREGVCEAARERGLGAVSFD